MYRPRNRQPRASAPPRSQAPQHRDHHHAAPRAVPTSAHVVPGAHVFIVLKADQPTGRQTRGTVQDVLTAGDHPRGIKVRLRDGQVGRVQRLDTESAPSPAVPGSTSGVPSPSPSPSASASASAAGLSGSASAWGSAYKVGGRHVSVDVRKDGYDYPYEEGPSERSLADYCVVRGPAGRKGPRHADGNVSGGGGEGGSFVGAAGAAVFCPICEEFEGDETAVTHHIERDHLG